MQRIAFLGLLVLGLVSTGCRSTYYKAMQTLGKEKRDILVQRVKDTKKDEEQTKGQLKTTMETFQELTGFQGGNLEKSYKKLDSEYQKAADQADKLHGRIKSIDDVSNEPVPRMAEGNRRDGGREAQIAQRSHASRCQGPPGRLYESDARHRGQDDAGPDSFPRSGAIPEAQPQRARHWIAAANWRFHQHRCQRADQKH